MAWQVVNQSVNVAVNYANRNASSEMTTADIATGYSVGVTASCAAVLGLGAAVNRARVSEASRTLLKRLVPFVAVASASALNVGVMRRNELTEGVNVTDEDGVVRGNSQVAARSAITKVAFSRVALALPIMTITPLANSVRAAWAGFIGTRSHSHAPQAIERTAWFKRNTHLAKPINLTLIAASLMVCVPMSIALFEQNERVPAAALEERFHGLKRADGSVVQLMTYNKGL